MISPVWGYVISVTATGIGLCSLWLYGNKDRRAPVLGLIVCSLWVLYDVIFSSGRF